MEHEKENLPKVARDVLNEFFETEGRIVSDFDLERISYELYEVIKVRYDYKIFSEFIPCFVTLLKSPSNQLRGCMGTLQATHSLGGDLVKNILLASFFDKRFPPLKSEELSNITIEVSLLSDPFYIDYLDEEELFNKIKNKGVILENGPHKATFLPQVWNTIKDEEEFLSELSLKAGLSPSSWKESNFKIYEVEEFSE